MADPAPDDPAPADAPQPPPAEPPERRADDFLAPVLFALIAAVRQAAARVAAVAVKGNGGVPSDPEAIHDFRVALRRLRTVLRPARRLWGKRRLREIGAELRRFAQATGALRDEEVLRETLAALEVSERVRADLEAWLVQRARQERALRRRVGSLIAATEPVTARGPSLGEALAHLERRLGRRRPEEHTARALADVALASAAAGVEELVGAHPSDVAAMHALRIRYKRLRYTAELFAPILGEGAAATAKAAARMQKRLGELHDLDEARARIARARGLSQATRAALNRALVGARAREGTRIRRDLVEERRRLGSSGRGEASRFRSASRS